MMTSHTTMILMMTLMNKGNEMKLIAYKYGRIIGADETLTLGDLRYGPVTDDEGNPLRMMHFHPVSDEEYDNTVIDIRFENGEWKQ